ncbi:hypothetical protein CRYUN_Cryun23aG0073900 [Craigia yunnanensis]
MVGYLHFGKSLLMGQKLDTMANSNRKTSCFIRLQVLETWMALKLFAKKVLALSFQKKQKRRERSNLRWKDSPVVACMNPELIEVAKALIEVDANVNAYRPGYNAGTSLHHAAKRGLEQTVKLLLSHGANALLRNDDCHTPLEVARIKGCTNVVRAIENYICYFSGWLLEFRGPGFLGGFAPQLLSTIWVVIIPCSSGNLMKPPRFELAMYSTLQIRPTKMVNLL